MAPSPRWHDDECGRRGAESLLRVAGAPPERSPCAARHHSRRARPPVAGRLASRVVGQHSAQYGPGPEPIANRPAARGTGRAVPHGRHRTRGRTWLRTVVIRAGRRIVGAPVLMVVLVLIGWVLLGLGAAIAFGQWMRGKGD